MPELGALNELVNDHPCFFADATLRRVSPEGSPVFALLRRSGDGRDTVLVLANNDMHEAQSLELDASVWRDLGEPAWDLASAPPAATSGMVEIRPDGRLRLRLAAGACHCLSTTPAPVGASGEAWRRSQLHADWALKVWTDMTGLQSADAPRLQWSSAVVANDPVTWLASASRAAAGLDPSQGSAYPNVVRWTADDIRRITPVPPGHWILLHDAAPFRAVLESSRPNSEPLRWSPFRPTRVTLPPSDRQSPHGCRA